MTFATGGAPAPGCFPSTVCAKGLREALVMQQVGLGATAPPPQIPGPKAPPFLLPLETGLCEHLSAPPAGLLWSQNHM